MYLSTVPDELLVYLCLSYMREAGKGMLINEGGVWQLQPLGSSTSGLTMHGTATPR